MDIISLTTIPSRLHVMEPCIHSLEKQGLPIYVYLPEYTYRTQQKLSQSDIPSFLKNCNISFVEDEGSITKMRPALRSNQFTRVITADDDVEYPEGWAQSLLEYSDKLTDCVICYRGRVMQPGKSYRGNKLRQNVEHPTAVNFVTGVHGVLYRPEFFSEAFLQSTEVTTVDDIDISKELNKNGVQMVVIPRPGPIVAQKYHKKDALCKFNVGKKQNDRALKQKGFWDVVREI